VVATFKKILGTSLSTHWRRLDPATQKVIMEGALHLIIGAAIGLLLFQIV